MRYPLQLIHTLNTKWDTLADQGKATLSEYAYPPKISNVSAKVRNLSANVPYKSESDIQVLYIEGVVFDELAAGFHVFPHQRGEDGFGLGDVFELDLEQSAPFRVHSGLP